MHGLATVEFLAFLVFLLVRFSGRLVGLWLAALRADHSGEVPAKGASFRCALLAQWNKTGKVLSEGIPLAHSFTEGPAKGVSFQSA